jgi:hypothetical protein
MIPVSTFFIIAAVLLLREHKLLYLFLAVQLFELINKSVKLLMLEQNNTVFSLIVLSRLNSNGDTVHYYNPENVQIVRNSTKTHILMNSATDVCGRSISEKILVKSVPDGGTDYSYNLKTGHE